MGLANVLRKGVAIINSVTSDLQVTVQHYAWISNNDDGESVYDNPVNLQAIVEIGKEQMLEVDGREMLVKGTSITVIGPIANNGATNRLEPIDPRDRFVLPDGSSGPILSQKGLADPLTGNPYMWEVFLG